MADTDGTLLEPTPEDDAPARPRRRLGLAIVGVLAALVLVVVGLVVLGGNDEPTPVELLSAAPDAAREARTALVAMTVEASGQGESMSFDGTGAIDFVSGASSLEMSLPGFTLEMRFIEGRMYMHLPEVGRPPGMTESWVSVPIPGAAGGGTQSQLGVDSAGYLESLAGVSEDGIEELGEQTIDGVETTGYHVEIDMDRAMAQLSPEEQADLEAAREQMDAMGLDSWPMDVWLTDDGLPARLEMNMDMTGVQVEVQVDFTDFGTDIDVAVPDPEDTREFDDVTEMQQELAGGAPAA